MKYFKKLTADNIYLSPINPEDLEQYTEWINDTELGIFFGQASRITTLASEKEYLENVVKAKDSVNLAIILKQGDKLLGNTSLMDLDLLNGTAELGIFMGDKDNLGKGYGTEAVKLLCEYGFRYLDLKNIMLRVFSYNPRAQRAYVKAGFREFGRRTGSIYLDGTRHDEIYMEITPERLDSFYLDGSLSGLQATR